MAHGHCEGGVNLVANDYSDVIVLTISSGACLYVVCYLSRKLEKTNWLRVLLSEVGRDSLYIMGFHFIGFKIASLLLRQLGVNASAGELVPSIGENFFYFLLYALFGVGTPILIISLVRLLKRIVLRRAKL